METTIVQAGHPALRQIAQEVSPEEIATPRISSVLSRMRSALEVCQDGVALAAPQIGESLRIFIIHPRAWKETRPKQGESLTYINPRILKRSRAKEELDEGCLSVRDIYGKTIRSARATVTALDEDGKPFVRGGSGLLAQIFQHEIDHLDGILFTDYATDITKAELPQTPNSKQKNHKS